MSQEQTGHAGRLRYTAPTPGAANATSGVGFAPEPVFSVAGGVFTVSSLTVRLAAPSGTIRYTTDGTTPTNTSPAYTGALAISSSTVVQARVFQAGLLPSAIVVQAYNLLGTSLTNFMIGGGGCRDRPGGVGCLPSPDRHRGGSFKPRV